MPIKNNALKCAFLKKNFTRKDYHFIQQEFEKEKKNMIEEE